MRKYKAKYEYIRYGKRYTERITFFSDRYANSKANYVDAKSEIRRCKGNDIADNSMIIFTYIDQ